MKVTNISVWVAAFRVLLTYLSSSNSRYTRKWWWSDRLHHNAACKDMAPSILLRLLTTPPISEAQLWQPLSQIKCKRLSAVRQITVVSQAISKPYLINGETCIERSSKTSGFSLNCTTKTFIQRSFKILMLLPERSFLTHLSAKIPDLLFLNLLEKTSIRRGSGIERRKF